VALRDGKVLQPNGRIDGAFELFKLESEVFEKTKVQIAPAKEEEEPEEN